MIKMMSHMIPVWLERFVKPVYDENTFSSALKKLNAISPYSLNLSINIARLLPGPESSSFNVKTMQKINGERGKFCKISGECVEVT